MSPGASCRIGFRMTNELFNPPRPFKQQRSVQSLVEGRLIKPSLFKHVFFEIPFLESFTIDVVRLRPLMPGTYTPIVNHPLRRNVLLRIRHIVY